MNGFPNQGFTGQNGTQFGPVVQRIYNYVEDGDGEDGLAQFNPIPQTIREDGKGYLPMSNLNSGHLCDNCVAFAEQNEHMSRENELLHQLVDNLRKRTKDSQAHGNLQMVRKYESPCNKEPKLRFPSIEAAPILPADQTFKSIAAKDEDKIIINRLKSEMDFYKALNANTESCWQKKLEDLQLEKETVIKELQNFIADNTETIARLTNELEASKQANLLKQDSINKLTCELFALKSSSQKASATLTAELEKVQVGKKDAVDRVFKMAHELALIETKSQAHLARANELEEELAVVKKENQEMIEKLNEKLQIYEGKGTESQSRLERLTKDLAETKAQYHQQMNKISKDIEAIQTAKGDSNSLSWRK